MESKKTRLDGNLHPKGVPKATFRCCPFVMLLFPTPSVIINHLTSRLGPDYGMPILPQANKPSFQELRILRRCHSARSALT